MFVGDYFLPAFFMLSFPEFKTQYAFLSASVCVIAAIISSVGGGILSDKLSVNNPRAYSQICTFGTLICLPFLLVTLLFSKNFYLAIFMLTLKCIFGENHWSPNITMI
jgi:uncharacterized membrane protein YeiH